MDIILGDNVPDTPDIPDTPDEPTIVWPDLITDPYPFNDSVIQFKFSKECNYSIDDPNYEMNNIFLRNLTFTEDDKEFSFEIVINTNRLYLSGSTNYFGWAAFQILFPSTCIDKKNGVVKNYCNGKFIEEGNGVNLYTDKYTGIVQIKGTYPVTRAGTEYQTGFGIRLYGDLKNKNN